MKSATLPRLVRDLHDGDCFFYTSPEEWAARELRILALNEFRASVGEKPLDSQEAAELIQATAQGYTVLATVLATKERVTLRLSDGAKHIWYDGSIPVRYSPDRSAFDARMNQMRQARKRMDDEEARMRRPRSKKKNAPEEISARLESTTGS